MLDDFKTILDQLSQKFIAPKASLAFETMAPADDVSNNNHWNMGSIDGAKAQTTHLE